MLLGGAKSDDWDRRYTCLFEFDNFFPQCIVRSVNKITVAVIVVKFAVVFVVSCETERDSESSPHALGLHL